jgi:putative ubiquitin-RnfH superfamily antitoxin RatB of RatAB toxin-antitoxin module
VSRIRILFAYAGIAGQAEIALEVPTGTTLQQALELCKAQIDLLLHGERAVATGVWGKVRPPHFPLREGDRIEFYRPLQADPKQARRARIGDRAKRG